MHHEMQLNGNGNHQTRHVYCTSRRKKEGERNDPAMRYRGLGRPESHLLFFLIWIQITYFPPLLLVREKFVENACLSVECNVWYVFHLSRNATA
jgi:hypothetical protein